jgi:serine/threonine-protein kinase
MTENKSNSDTASMDTELGRLIVEHGLATREEVDECQSLVQQAEPPSQKSLGRVLVEQAVVTERQIQRIKATIEETQKGRQIPGYELMHKIGSGAMATVFKATVFKARQLSLDRIVAIKVLPKRLSENKEYVERFYKEGRAAAKLNHPNIVQAFDVGEANGYHYFVMEYVEGHSLYEELVTGKVFSEPDAMRIIIQIARALEHAHSQGLIHRDVKPKNIMITRDGTAKLADMGLARVAADAEAAKAEAGRAYGTPYYISPEQIRGEVGIDFRADIYSLGATLYHLVTGRVPFEAPTPAAVMHKHLREPLIPPDHINMRLSTGIGEVVEAMMAKDRNQRYSSTSDLLMDLQSIAAGEPPLQARRQISADVLSGLTGGDSSREGTEGAPAPGRWNLVIFIIILIAALVASVFLNVFLLAGGSSP